MGKYKLLVMDVDGTLTDGKIYMGPDGEVFKAFDVKDGYAIKHMLPELGIKSAIITGRVSDIVKKRADELNVDFLFQGINNKNDCLNEIVELMNISLNQVIYIGDDVNDLECIKAVNLAGGYSVCPQNAVKVIKENVKKVLQENGGDGCLRILVEEIINGSIIEL